MSQFLGYVVVWLPLLSFVVRVRELVTATFSISRQNYFLGVACPKYYSKKYPVSETFIINDVVIDSKVQELSASSFCFQFPTDMTLDSADIHWCILPRLIISLRITKWWVSLCVCGVYAPVFRAQTRMLVFSIVSLHLRFWDTVLQKPWSLLIWLGWSTSKPQGPSCLFLVSIVITGMYCDTQIFTQVKSMHIRPFHLCIKSFTDWVISLAAKIMCFFFFATSFLLWTSSENSLRSLISQTVSYLIIKNCDSQRKGRYWCYSLPLFVKFSNGLR